MNARAAIGGRGSGPGRDEYFDPEWLGDHTRGVQVQDGRADVPAERGGVVAQERRGGERVRQLQARHFFDGQLP